MVAGASSILEQQRKNSFEMIDSLFSEQQSTYQQPSYYPPLG
jgi:hypothetical protein